MKFYMPFTLFFILINQSLKGQSNYSILDFGAFNDTAKLSTKAINAAVSECHLKGGGRVVIPAGNYKSGTITLKDNVELYLESGATLYASTNPNDFPQQQQPVYRSQKDPGGWFALIYAEGAQNVGINGKGIIDGQGAQQKPRPGSLGGDRDGRPRNILLISCKKVSIEGITMRNAGIWNQHYLNCEDVMVNHINVFNHSNKNNDGIDIDGCRGFVLSNSIIDSDDDGIVLKSTGPAACENVAISNCIVSSFTNAIKCGTESTGGFKNIAISNCVVKPSVSSLKSIFGYSDIGITGISLEVVDGGVMDGVNINNVVINGTECPIYVRLGNRARKHKEGALEPPYGKMKNIQISNVTAWSSGNYSSSITGVPGSPIENISLSNILLVNKGGLKTGEFLVDINHIIEDEKGYPEPTIWKNLPSYGFFIRHVTSLNLSSISLSSKQTETRYPVIADDVSYLKIRDFSVLENKKKLKFLINNVRLYELEKNIIHVTNGN